MQSPVFFYRCLVFLRTGNSPEISFIPAKQIYCQMLLSYESHWYFCRTSQYQFQKRCSLSAKISVALLYPMVLLCKFIVFIVYWLKALFWILFIIFIRENNHKINRIFTSDFMVVFGYSVLIPATQCSLEAKMCKCIKFFIFFYSNPSRIPSAV